MKVCRTNLTLVWRCHFVSVRPSNFLNGDACWQFSFFVCIGWTNFGNLTLHMAHKVEPTMANKHALLVKKHNNDKLGAYNEIVRLAFQNTQKCTNRKLCGISEWMCVYLCYIRRVDFDAQGLIVACTLSLFVCPEYFLLRFVEWDKWRRRQPKYAYDFVWSAPKWTTKTKNK